MDPNWSQPSRAPVPYGQRGGRPVRYATNGIHEAVSSNGNRDTTNNRSWEATIAAMKISIMALRVLFLVNLVLGILFWSGNEPGGLVLLHMLCGIAFVALLWVVGTLAALRTGNMALQVVTFLVGLLIAIVGLSQRSLLVGSSHWLVQVVHLLLALIGIGLAEMCGARVRRKARAAKPA